MLHFEDLFVGGGVDNHCGIVGVEDGQQCAVAIVGDPHVRHDALKIVERPPLKHDPLAAGPTPDRELDVVSQRWRGKRHHQLAFFLITPLLLAGGDVPLAVGLIAAERQQAFAVRRECERADFALVPQANRAVAGERLSGRASSEAAGMCCSTWAGKGGAKDTARPNALKTTIKQRGNGDMGSSPGAAC